jgi:hypothetical protein
MPERTATINTGSPTVIDSVQNRWLYNEVHDDRANDGTVRWGMTFTGSPAYLQVIGNVVSLDDSVTLAIRFYNWNVDYGVFKDNYYGNGSGYRKFLPTGSVPTAREELRGDVWTVPGAAGVRDTTYICQKDTADAYGWEGLPDKATVLIGTATWDMTSTNDTLTNSTTVTVTGVQATDIILASYDAIANLGNVFISANYQSANTVRVQVYNRTGGAIDPASGTVSVMAFRLT